MGRLALCLALAPSLAAAADREGWEELRQPAKVFALQDLEGKALRSTELMGKVVVVDFWATWCAPCVRELPDLAAYHQRLSSRTDVAFLSFNVTDERETLEAFVKQKKVPFPVYKADALIGPYELAVFPTKLVVDMRGAGPGQPGVVRFRREGPTPMASIEARVAEVLGEKP
jgi:thiol-disulfide isomerase/thioredoxin